MDVVVVIMLAVGYYVIKALAAKEENRDYGSENSISGSSWTDSIKKNTALRETGAEWKKKAESLSRDLRAAVSEAQEGTISAAEMRKAFASGEKKKSGKRPSPSEIKAFHEKRLDDEWEESEQRNARERALNEKRFASARTKQSNADTVHAVHIDSCEGRLESLRVLYDAGILDREEYQQRVARVKAQHRNSTQ